jgi:N-acetylmuramoyl-L-alanine amidase
MLDAPPQIVCIAQAIHAESRGESDRGQRAVAHVILNRSKKFNKTPCEIVREPGQFKIKLRKRHDTEAWDDAYNFARNPGRDPTAGALYFKNAKCAVSWAYKLTTRIGNHIFYK